MKINGIKITEIPATRKVRSDTELRSFMVKDQAALEKGAKGWVHQTSRDALAMTLHAGNPTRYFISIDGVTNASGTVKRSFRAGQIGDSNTAVRIEFNGETLSAIARAVPPILASVIHAIFPRSKTGRLARDWSWWVYRKGSNGSRRAGKTPPADLGLEDVLYLAPDFHTSKYAYFALSNSRESRLYNMVTKRGFHKLSNARRRKTARGYIAEATAQLRAKRVPGVQFQGRFSTKYMSARAAKSTRRGIPIIRVAYRGLKKEVWV